MDPESIMTEIGNGPLKVVFDLPWKPETESKGMRKKVTRGGTVTGSGKRSIATRFPENLLVSTPPKRTLPPSDLPSFVYKLNARELM